MDKLENPAESDTLHHKDWIIIESYQTGGSPNRGDGFELTENSHVEPAVHKGTWVVDVTVENGNAVAMETLTIAHEGLQ